MEMSKKNMKIDKEKLLEEIKNKVSDLGFEQKLKYLNCSTGKRLEDYQKEIDLSDEHMAVLFDIKTETYRKIKNGSRSVTVEHLCRLSAYKKPDLNYLIYGESETGELLFPEQETYENPDIEKACEGMDIWINNFDYLMQYEKCANKFDAIWSMIGNWIIKRGKE